MTSALLVIHVLGWVFWLGTDIGVYLAAKRSERRDLGVEARLAVLELGMVLDRAPRFAVPIVLGTGLLLLNGYGLAPLPPAAAIALMLGWIVIVWLGIFQPPGTPLQARAMQIQTLIYLFVIGGALLWATLGLVNATLPLWVALKGYAYALIGIAALILEKTFAPAVADYQALAEQGSSPPLEADLHAHLQPVYRSVLVIYAGTALAGIAGLLKPVL
ncbi:MAG: hypothetical protein AAGI15_06805 [Pseudomonadota bacterium]